MDIIVSGKNLKLTEALKDSVESHLNNMKVSYPKLNKAEVVLSHGHGEYKVEIVLHGNKIDLDAHAETDEILGVHMIGPRAADMIAEAVVAMEFRASAEDISRMSHAHPTFTEAIKEAALAATGDRALHV